MHYLTCTNQFEFNAETFPKEIVANLKDLQEELNLEGTDKINWKEFLAATMDKNLAMRQDKVQLAFDHFKRSDSINIQMGDLVELLGGETQAKEIMTFIDSDGDGKITFDDFFGALKESVEAEDDDPMDAPHF
jgi:Ca2+-binding EF-hand superfamily protein